MKIMVSECELLFSINYLLFLNARTRPHSAQPIHTHALYVDIISCSFLTITKPIFLFRFFLGEQFNFISFLCRVQQDPRYGR